MAVVHDNLPNYIRKQEESDKKIDQLLFKRQGINLKHISHCGTVKMAFIDLSQFFGFVEPFI
jgi:hypothetical protein